MTLASTQRAFQAHILAEDTPAPAGWDQRMLAGMEIYRSGYRSRLVDALKETFPKTCEWVGDGPFERAAAHHLITSPPGNWTLDDTGRGFPELLADLFANDPEVAELAWLEWAMHCAFTAADAVPLDAAGFAQATASFAEEDWGDLRLTFLPGTMLRKISTCCDEIWKALTQKVDRPTEILLAEPPAIIVWREGLSPVFQQLTALEAECFEQMQAGESFGSICEFLVSECGDEGVAQAGTMLGQWIAQGRVGAIETH